MNNELKMKRGITLIALVVTIIVLLILAGVAMNLIIGDDGIVNKTLDAKNSYDKSAIAERFSTILTNYKIEHLANDISLESFINNPNKNGGAILRDQNAEYYVIEFENLYFMVSKDGDILGDLNQINIPGVLNIQLSINDLVSNTELEVTAATQYEEGKENDDNSIIRRYKFSIYKEETLIDEITTTDSTTILNNLNPEDEYRIFVTGYNNNNNTIKSGIVEYTKKNVYAWNKYEANSEKNGYKYEFYMRRGRGTVYSGYDLYKNTSYSTITDLEQDFNPTTGVWTPTYTGTLEIGYGVTYIIVSRRWQNCQ